MAPSVVLWFGVLAVSVVVAQDASSDLPALRYHRALVPSEFILKSSDYLPLRRREFQERVLKANSKVGGATNAYVEFAEYTCKFQEGALGDGTAEIRISIPDRRACTLSLDSLNLATKSARWSDGSRAQLGSARDGIRLYIPKSIASSGNATLLLQWSFSGTLDAFDGAEFDMRLPKALSTRIRITSYRPVEVTSDRGLVRKNEETKRVLDDTREIGSESEVWTVELGGRAECLLIISPERASADNPLVIYRQTTDYNVSLSGTEIETRVFVRKSSQPIRRFSLETNSNVQIKNVDWNGATLSWRSVPATFLDRQYIVVLVPPSQNANEDVLTVLAAAPVKLNALSGLPSIRPRQMHWKSGTVDVSIADNLELKNYEIRNGRQVRRRVGALRGIGIKAESARSSVALDLNPATRLVRIANGVTADIGDEAVMAECVVELSESPKWHRLVADILPDWTIEDVTAADPDVVGDWETFSVGDERQLGIEIRPSPFNASPLLRIRAVRELSDAVVALTQTDVTPLAFHDVEYIDDVRCLRSNGGVRLAFDSPHPISDSNAGEERSSLISQRPGDLVYALNEKTSRALIQIQESAPQFTANTNVVLRVDDSSVSEKFEIQWVPQNSKIERALVHLSHSRDVPPHWTFVDPAPYEIVARRLAQDKQEQAGLGATGETWQFVMHDLGTEPRTIRGFREFTPADPDSISPSLIRLPDARSQRATLSLENDSAHEYRIAASTVEATFTPSDSDTARDATIGSFRYIPKRDAVGAAAPVRLVRILSDSEKTLVNCWAWTSQLDSHFSPDGTSQHRFCYRIENHGRRTIELRASADLNIRRVAIGESVIVPDEDQSSVVRIELPRNASDVSLVVNASTRQQPWRFTNALDVEFLRIDVPVVQSQWTVWLPDGYQPLSIGRRIQRQSVPWTEQVFGWAGQGAQRLSSWIAGRRIVDAGRLTTNSTIEDFYKSIQSQADKSLRFGQQRTWGEVLRSVAAECSVPTLIDQRALRAVGITPNARFEPGSSLSVDEAFTLRGIELVLDELGLIVSTDRRRGLWPESFANTIWPDVFQMRDGPLRAAILGGNGFPTATRWADGLGVFELLDDSQSPKQTIASQQSLNAWHVNVNHPRQGIVQGGIRVVRKQVFQVLGWLCFAISTTLVWRVRRYVPYLASGMLLAGIVTLFSTGAIQPIALGLMFGTVLGFFLRHVSSSSNGSVEQEMHPDSTVVRSVYKPFSSFTTFPTWILIWVSAIAFVTAMGNVAAAQDGRSVDTPHSYQVLIPVDKAQKPAGEFLFLPVEFYHKLLKLDAPKSPTTDWLIRRARYVGRLAVSEDQDRNAPNAIRLDELSVTFEVETFRHNVNVPIPMDPSVLNVGPSAVGLDGRGIRPTFEAMNSGSTIKVALPGSHRLRLMLDPTSVMDPSGTRMRLGIPEIPDATLSLAAPEQVKIQVPSAVGASSRTDDGRLSCDLGPARVLAFRWQVTPAARQSKKSVQLISMLDVQPNQAFLATKIRVQNDDATDLRQVINLSFDASVQWLPSPQTAFARIVESGDADKNRLRVALNRQGTTDEPIQFLLKSPRANRSVQVPLLTVESTTVSEHWLGVRPNTDTLIAYPEAADRISASAFEEAWGDNANAIQEAFRIDPKGGGWSLGVQPVVSSVSCDEGMEVMVDGATATIHYQAIVNSSGSDLYKHVFESPRGLSVKHISIQQGERVLSSNWSQAVDKTFVFVREPLDGAYQIEITGKLPIDTDAPQPVPMLWMKGTEMTNHRLRLFRAPRTRISIADVKGFRQSHDRNSVDMEKGAWRIAELQTSSPDSASAQMTTKFSAPILEGRMLTTVLRDDAGWKAKGEYRLRATQGPVGLVVINLPDSWRETLSVTPEIPYAVVDTDGDARALQLWFEAPQQGEFAFEIVGVLDNSEAVSVPELRPVHLESVVSHVRIPASTLTERFTWTTSRLTVEHDQDATRGFSAPLASTEYTTYRASPGFRVQLDSTEPHENMPHVSLTEVNHVIGRNVDYGVATFHIEPSGDPSTVLAMPPTSALLDASVGSLPAQVHQLDETHYRVHLGANRLPHRLRVAYQIPHPPRPSGKWELSSPVLNLSENSNGRTLWRISTLDDTSQTNEVLSERSLSRLESALAHVSALHHLFQAPDIVSIDYSDPEVTGWHRHWKEYISKRMNNARRLLAVNEDELTAAEFAYGKVTIQDAEERLWRIEQQLAGQTTDPAFGELSLPVAPPLDTPFGSTTRYYSTGPGVTKIDVNTSPIGSFDYVHRLLAATLMVVAGCVLALVSDSEYWENWLAMNWPLMLAIFALVWWFALYPKWLSVVFLSLGVICYVTLRRGTAFRIAAGA